MTLAIPDVVHALIGAQHGLIARHQLNECGVSDRVIARLVRRRCLFRLHEGAFVEPQAWKAANDVERHCLRTLAIQLRAPDAAAYAVSGAVVWGLSVRRIPSRPMLIRAPDTPGLTHGVLRRSRFVSEHLTRHRGLLVTTMPKTVVDVAAEVPFADALITLDAALRSGVSAHELHQICQAAPPVRNLAAVRAALEAGNPYSESWLESLSRGRMIDLGLPLPLCNVVLRSGHRWGRVDFLLAELGVVGEADGIGKYQEADDPAAAVVRERHRHAWIEDLGFEVARWGTAEVVGDAAPMAQRINRAIARQQVSWRGWPDGVRAEVPLLGAVRPPPGAISEVTRLASLGYPICFTDASGRAVDVSRPAA